MIWFTLLFFVSGAMLPGVSVDSVRWRERGSRPTSATRGFSLRAHHLGEDQSELESSSRPQRNLTRPWRVLGLSVRGLGRRRQPDEIVFAPFQDRHDHTVVV